MTRITSAFYINLDRRVDRRDHIEAQLERAGIAAERVSAVTPADLDPDIVAAVGGSMSPTELACSYSHRKVWQIMRDRGLTGALVLEDDAVLSSDIPATLAADGLAERVDALQLESHPSNALVGRALKPGGTVTLNRLMSSSLGTCAYYITTRFAMQVLEHPLLDHLAVDRVLFGRGGGLIYGARIYQSVPALAVQLESYAGSTESAARSDLEPMRIAGRSRKPRTFAARLRKIMVNATHALRVVGSFGPSGDLFAARQLQLPVADDIRAKL